MDIVINAPPAQAATMVMRFHAVRSCSSSASWRWALAVLLAGLGFTIWLAIREWQDLNERADEQRKALVHIALRQLDTPLQTVAAELRAIQTFFLVNNKMDQARFTQLTENLQRQHLSQFRVATAFAQRYANNSEIYRYELVAPMRGNEILLGMNVSTRGENLFTLEQARDSNSVVMSAPFRLRQAWANAVPPLGVTVRLPVYSDGPEPLDITERRRREIGALAISLCLDTLIRDALKGEVLDNFDVGVRDLSPVNAMPFFYSGTGVEPGTGYHRALFQFGGRRWELRLWPRPTHLDSERLHMIIGIGPVISLLLAALLWSLVSTRQRAILMGHEMSALYRQSEAQFRTLNELLPALVLLSDGDGRILYANQAARQRLGDVVSDGVPLTALFADPVVRESVRHPVQSHDYWSNVEALLVGAEGEFWASASIAHVEMEEEARLLMVATDISEQRQLTEQLSYQATHDALTDLCNRREFERRIELALDERRRGGRSCALLYIDLDQFKLINDVSGHIAGDQLLAQLARTMRLQLRNDDLLARLGGDEFGVLAFDVDTADVRLLAERLRRGIESQTFVWEERTYTVSASIGVTVVEQDEATLKDLLAWSDTACYVAKEKGRNRVHIYSDDDDATLRYSEMQWANRLRWALEEQRLLLDYQEIVPLNDQHDDGTRVELLLRMREDDGRIIPPGAFLPAAERYGLMPMVDRWVIRTALSHFDHLIADGRPLLRCGINLSGASIEDESLADFILDLTEKYNVAPSRLCFEITETVAVRNLLKVIPMVERLRQAGCQIALDDFGTGMSSFGYLKNLPADIIKIDGSFIRDMDTDPMSRVIANSITQIGHQRGLKVVAEWVSDEGMVPCLIEMGVDCGQGMALHAPEQVLFQRLMPMT